MSQNLQGEKETTEKDTRKMQRTKSLLRLFVLSVRKRKDP